MEGDFVFTSVDVVEKHSFLEIQKQDDLEPEVEENDL
jgi:hypothetical protein